MLFYLLLTAGIAVLSLALRSVNQPLVFRLGNLCMLAASYLLGWTLTESPLGGFACVSLWFLFPWIDIIGRVRPMELPATRPIEAQAPPGSGRFPDLGEITEEIEAEGFVQVEDVGWEHAGQRHFVRLLTHPTEPERVSISLVESDDFVFFYLTLSSRTAAGKLWHTWNYPFSQTLKRAPNWNLQSLREVESFLKMLLAHRSWLAAHDVHDTLPAAPDARTLTAELQEEIRIQVSHNLDCGILLTASEGFVRYSWKGCFFLWFQFLREIARWR